MVVTLEDVRKSFEEMPFFQYMGFEIDHFDEENVLLKLKVNDQLINTNHTLHGGVHAAMLDQVLSMCIRSRTLTRCVTINLNLNYIAPSNSGTIYAKGRIVQLGYRIATAEGEVYTEDGTILAKGIGNFKLIRD